jgi:hypothetical protein
VRRTFVSCKTLFLPVEADSFGPGFREERAMGEDGFSRFPAQTLEFLSGIEGNNGKEWFEALGKWLLDEVVQ